MSVIHKYNLSLAHGTHYANMPANAKILTVARQRDDMVIWAEVEPEAPTRRRRFYNAYTGGDVPVNNKYLGTVVLYDGIHVIHLYDIGEE